MRLGKSILTADGRILLQAGTMLRESLIEPLLAHGVLSVYVVNELAPDVEPEDVVQEETRRRLKQELHEVVSEMEQMFREAATTAVRHFQGRLHTKRIRQVIDQILNEIMANPKATVSLQDIRLADDYTLGHSVNVCILSTLLAIEMEYSPQEVRDLALGALLHDVGKTAVPSEVLNKPDKLTPEEMEIMNQHTTLGWMILREQRDVSYTSAIVALQHHERWAGGGYPMNLSGNQIFKYSRICAIADCYDAMTSDRIYRRGMNPRAALETLSGPMHGFFEPTSLLAFLNCIAPWPVGAMVEITGGHKAVVVEAVRGRADRPRVRVVLEPDGSRVSQPYELDLSRKRDIEIIRQLHDDAEAYLRTMVG